MAKNTRNMYHVCFCSTEILRALMEYMHLENIHYVFVVFCAEAVQKLYLAKWKNLQTDETFAQSALLHKSWMEKIRNIRRDQILISTGKLLVLAWWKLIKQKVFDQLPIIRLFLCRRKCFLAGGHIWSWYEEKLSRWLSSRIIKWTQSETKSCHCIGIERSGSFRFLHFYKK